MVAAVKASAPTAPAPAREATYVTYKRPGRTVLRGHSGMQRPAVVSIARRSSRRCAMDHVEISGHSADLVRLSSFWQRGAVNAERVPLETRAQTGNASLQIPTILPWDATLVVQALQLILWGHHDAQWTRQRWTHLSQSAPWELELKAS